MLIFSLCGLSELDSAPGRELYLSGNEPENHRQSQITQFKKRHEELRGCHLLCVGVTETMNYTREDVLW